MIAAERAPNRALTNSWQAGFLELLPAIQKQARRGFRGLGDEAREEAVAEVIASAACAYARLCERGELRRAFASALVRYAIRQYFDGRRTGTPDCSHDVYAQAAKRTARFELKRIGAPGDSAGLWREGLTDNRRTPVPDQASFRLDFPRWLDQLTPRDRKIAECLALQHSTGDVAKAFNLSSGRVSQLRKELANSWRAFIAPAAAQTQGLD